MTFKKIVYGVVGLTLVGGGIWYFQSRNTAAIVPTETVARGDVFETVSVTGELIPVMYADLAFVSAGVLDRVAVKVGDRVEEGDIIASLDRSVLASQLRTGRIALSIAEKNERLARRTWDDLKPEERAVKKLTTEQARENVRTLSAQLENNVLTAPFAGRISISDVRVGEVVTLGTTIARLVQGDEMHIKARIPESDIAKVALGMTASVTFDAFSTDEKYIAHVTKIDPAATVIQDVVSYNVEFILESPDPRLREGMTANVDIETGKREGVLTVPFRALSKEGGKNYAEVKRGEDQYERVEVVTGLEGDEGTVEIKSGLKEGDQVTIGAKQQK